MHQEPEKILVLEFTPIVVLAQGDTLQLQYTSLWTPTPNGIIPPSNHIPGNGCSSSFGGDLVFLSNSSIVGASISDAQTVDPGDNGEIFNVTFVIEMANTTSPFQPLMSIGSNSIPTPITYFSVIASSLDTLVNNTIIQWD